MSRVSRRETIQFIAGAGAVGAACSKPHTGQEPVAAAAARVARTEKLSAPPWPTDDPFLFCVHHDDKYPRGTAELGPRTSLSGRALGRDFSGKDGFSMYHGRVVPGFPQHPHRGFETITVVRNGLLDHSDSLGARARYGEGDVQWLTAGAGILHSEMFPLLNQEADNPIELFQIWLNLPRENKLVRPEFKMLWAEAIPHRTWVDERGRRTDLSVFAGQLSGLRAPSPPPDSWASIAANHVVIATLKLSPRAEFSLPAADVGVNRSLYYFSGDRLSVAGEAVPSGHRLQIGGTGRIRLSNGPAASELLLLQARPIGEPVAKQGPFVMNTEEEIEQAFADFRRTRFGGWPWPNDDPVHGMKRIRFASRPSAPTEFPG